MGSRKPAVSSIESFTRGVLARRRLVDVLWLVVTVVGLASGPETDIKTLATGPARLLHVASSPLRPKAAATNP